MSAFQFPPASSSNNTTSTSEDIYSHSQERLPDRRFSLPSTFFGFPFDMYFHPSQHNHVDQLPVDNVSELARRMSLQYPFPDLGLGLGLDGLEFDATASPALSPESMINLMNSPIPATCSLSSLRDSYSNTEFSRRASLPFAFPNDSSGLLATFENTPEYYNTNSTEDKGSIDTSDAFASSPLRRRSSLPVFPTSSATTTHPHLASIQDLSVKSLLRNDDSEAGMDLLLATPPSTPPPITHAHLAADGSKKLNRFKPTESELLLLVSIFQKNPFPSANFQKKVAENMGVNVKQIRFWFQNRRATMKHNGIYVLKPRKSGDFGYNMAKKRTFLSPLSAESAYFFVQSDSNRNAANVDEDAEFDV
ncbi:UNVERIFIED_CONTAM: hypothetical protein HDU68_007336 [Siphonaria sp. JEL0065]|nr:hypothetical protein HDU68_007336 [Siphonaria sp. JEL0065]